MTEIMIFFTGVLAWLTSTLAGGGGGTVFLPVSALFLPTRALAPATSVAGFISSSQRIFLYFKNINMKIALITMPPMIVGSFAGAYVFSNFSEKTFALFLAAFYIVNGVWSFLKKGMTFRVKPWYFPAAGLASAFLSGEVGVGGPFMNPFFINYGIKKEEMLGTKAVCLMATQITKVITYAVFGALNREILFLGLIAGTGALTGNYIGKKLLVRMSDKTFSNVVNVSLIICAFIIMDKYWFNLF